MNPDQTLIDYIQHTQAAIEQAGRIQAADTARRNKTAAYLPETVDAVIASGLIAATEREKLASRLTDPVIVLQLLKQATARLRVANAAQLETTGAMGEPAKGRSAIKAASATPQTYFGGTRSTNPRESDLAFERGLFGR
jgi:hypothetical protein